MSRASIKVLVALGICSLHLLANAAPSKTYPALLVEARVVPARNSEQAIVFEVVVEALSDGEQKTLRLDGQDGMDLGLLPGQYYRVTEYGINRTGLASLTSQEWKDLFSTQSKKKRKRDSR